MWSKWGALRWRKSRFHRTFHLCKDLRVGGRRRENSEEGNCECSVTLAQGTQGAGAGGRHAGQVLLEAKLSKKPALHLVALGKHGMFLSWGRKGLITAEIPGYWWDTFLQGGLGKGPKARWRTVCANLPGWAVGGDLKTREITQETWPSDSNMIDRKTQSDKKKSPHIRKVLLKSMMLFRANLIRKSDGFHDSKSSGFQDSKLFGSSFSCHRHQWEMGRERLPNKTPNLSHLWWEFS